MMLKKLPFLSLTFLLFVGCGADRPVGTVGGPVEPDFLAPTDQAPTQSLIHMPMRCDTESCGGGYLPPTPPPTIQSVVDVQYCSVVGTCATPTGFTNQGGRSYDGRDHRLFEKFATVAVNQTYIQDMKTAIVSVGVTPPTFAGFTRFATQCDGDILPGCIHFYRKDVTFTGLTPSQIVLNEFLCIPLGADAWSDPNCNGTSRRPSPTRGGRLVRLTPNDNGEHCFWSDSNADPICYNAFIEVTP